MKVTSVDLTDMGATEGTVIGIRKRSRMECDASAWSVVADKDQFVAAFDGRLEDVKKYLAKSADVGGKDHMASGTKPASGLSRLLTESSCKKSEWEEWGEPVHSDGGDDTPWLEYRYKVQYAESKEPIIFKNRFNFELILEDDCKVFEFQVSKIQNFHCQRRCSQMFSRGMAYSNIGNI